MDLREMKRNGNAKTTSILLQFRLRGFTTNTETWGKVFVMGAIRNETKKLSAAELGGRFKRASYDAKGPHAVWSQSTSRFIHSTFMNHVQRLFTLLISLLRDTFRSKNSWRRGWRNRFSPELKPWAEKPCNAFAKLSLLFNYRKWN